MSIPATRDGGTVQSLPLLRKLFRRPSGALAATWLVP